MRGARLFLSISPSAAVTTRQQLVYRVTVAELDNVEAFGGARVEPGPVVESLIVLSVALATLREPRAKE